MKIGTAGHNLPAGIEMLRGRKDSSALQAVAKEMESLFAYEMIKAMRKTVGAGGESKGFGNDAYATMFDMELGRILSERGMGLREMLMRELGQRQDSKGKPGPLSGVEGAKEARKTEIGDTGIGKIGIHKTETGKTAARLVEMPHAHEEAGEVGIPHADAGAHPAGTPQVDTVLDKNTGEAAIMPGCIECAKPIPPAEMSVVEDALPIRNGARVSSGYGFRKDPFTGTRKFHRGIDIAAPGGTPIHSVRSGRVVFSGRLGGFGNMIMIDHGDGFSTRYAHTSVNLVKEGDYVGPDTVIGLVGSTGRSTGPHLHFEALRNGENIDPAPVFEAKSVKDLHGTSDNPVGRTLTGKDDA